MKIILARHGKPDISTSQRVSPRDLAGWIEKYNQAGIQKMEAPQDIRGLAECARLLVCSALPRSKHSVHLLCENRAYISDALYNEAGLRHVDWVWPVLPAYIWVSLFRAMWFVGFGQNSVSLHAARARAGQAAGALVALAEQNQTVLLVGHGIMNNLIAGHLRKHGWTRSARPKHNYWSATTYYK